MLNFYDTDAITLRVDQKERYLFCEWKRTPNFAEFKEGYLKIYDACKTHKLTHILSDQRRIEKIEMKARMWGMIEFFPKLKRAIGELNLALVAPHNKTVEIVGKLTMTALERTTGKGKVRYGHFKTLEEGKAWLLAQGKR